MLANLNYIFSVSDQVSNLGIGRVAVNDLVKLLFAFFWKISAMRGFEELDPLDLVVSHDFDVRRVLGEKLDCFAKNLLVEVLLDLILLFDIAGVWLRAESLEINLKVVLHLSDGCEHSANYGKRKG